MFGRGCWLLVLLLSLWGCTRQVRDYEEGRVYRPVLLLPEQKPSTEHLKHLFQHTQALRTLMPRELQAWTAAQAQMLPRLQRNAVCVLERQPQAVTQALRPYQRLGRLPLAYEWVRVPVESELSELTQRVNREMALAYRALGALEMAQSIQSLLPPISLRPENDPLPGEWAAQSIASVSWLNVLLQAEQAAGPESQPLRQRLLALEREIGQFQTIRRQRLRLEPQSARFVQDEIALLGDLLESTRRARSQLSLLLPQLPQALIQADGRLEQSLNAAPDGLCSS